MSVSTAIGLVSESLHALLTGEMDLTPDVPVTILAPDEGGGDRRINLFLYKVMENPFLRNQEWQVSSENSGRLVPPPLSLNLYYLLTPYAVNDDNLGNASIHEILGEAMRVLYEFSVVPPIYLAGDLDQAREQITITQNSLDMEELSHVWNTFSEPFRLSVLYEVSVVQLDQGAARQRDMPPRVREVGVPRIQAPYRPPDVHTLAPVSGPAGTQLTFTGENLEGWNAYVSVLENQIADGVDIPSNQFQVTLPGDLAPGFYEIRVDVSHLFRRTFWFEVTA